MATAQLEAPPVARQHDAKLIEQVKRLNLSQTELARGLGISASVVNQWLAGKYAGDVDGFEARLRSHLETLALQEDAPVVPADFLETAPVSQVFGAFERTIRLGAISLVIGAPGIGKTSASVKYRELKPTAVYVVVSRRMGSDWGLERLLLRALRTRGAAQHDSPWDYLISTLRGSSRLLIIDNGHKLNGSGYEFVFDLWDATGIPIALVGNECMEGDIRGHTLRQRERNVQHVRRTAQRFYIRPKFAPEHVRALCRAILGRAHPDVEQLAVDLVKRPNSGHLGTLVNVLRGMEEFLARNDPADAFGKSLATTLVGLEDN